MIIKKIRGLDIDYINIDSVKYIDLRGAEARLVCVDGRTFDIESGLVAENVLSGFVKCDSRYVNSVFVVSVKINAAKNGIVLISEGGGEENYSDISIFSKFVNSGKFFKISLNDGSEIIINSNYVNNYERPYVTTQVLISSDGKTQAINAQIEGNPAIVIRLGLHKIAEPLSVSGLEAKQVLAIIDPVIEPITNPA